MPPRPPDDAARDAALAVLITTLTAQLLRASEQLERLARAVEGSTTAIQESTRAANPWAVAAAAVAVGRLAVERIPPWGLTVIVLVPFLGVTLAAAPSAGPILSSVVSAVLPGPSVAAP